MTARSERKYIFVYADWQTVDGPLLMGTLAVDIVRGQEVFSFDYDADWLAGANVQQLDPDLQLYPGDQYLAEEKPNFGIFTDSSPDRWGRVLMKRREAILARIEKRAENNLHESDFLLGVFDTNRMGALRFKREPDGEFLNNEPTMATPPWTRLRELEHASLKLEEDGAESSPEYLQWINMLISPGASLGGARPKASVVDENKNLWIAKFPSRFDDTNVGGWEMVANKIALDAGVNMAECHVQKFNNDGYTFLTKRFDRGPNQSRIHFASAMTCLGRVDGAGNDTGVSYLDLVEFIVQSGSRVNDDLEQLWRRIVLNICISNVDDHLRNHGFLLTDSGWKLSPAYDINPVSHGNGLTLNISENDNSQNLDLALSVTGFFRLDQAKAELIIEQVKSAVSKWRTYATELEISPAKQNSMAKAFRL